MASVHGVVHAPIHGPKHGVNGFWSAGVPVTDPIEAMEASALNTYLGFGSADIWREIWRLNETSVPLGTDLGMAPLTSVTGTPTFGAAGPLDSYDKGVAFTDGQVARVDSANGAVTFGSNHWAVLVEAQFTGLPAANRFIAGHDGTEDCFLQYMAGSGNVRGVVVGGTIATVAANIAANHNNGVSHTFLFVGIMGANITCASEMGSSGAVSIAAEAAFDFTSTWRIGGGNAFPGTISYMAVAISDGSVAQNNAVISLRDNISTAISNYRTATGR